MNTDNETLQSTGSWPGFAFRVTIPHVAEVVCKEVSGIDPGYDECFYRAGDGPEVMRKVIPGLRKTGDVTLKQGLTEQGQALKEWGDRIHPNDIQREEVTISLVGEAGEPVKQWQAVNAWPKKLAMGEVAANGNLTTVETLVLAHEGVLEL